jgi:alpha-D-xyloside xylohydrolase
VLAWVCLAGSGAFWVTGPSGVALARAGGTGGNGKASATAGAPDAAASPDPADGLVLRIGDSHYLEVQICAEDLVRVTYGASRAFLARSTLATAARRCVPTPWQRLAGHDAAQVTIRTAKLNVHVELATGAVRFHDRADRPILVEQAGSSGRMMIAAEVQGESTFHVRQQWRPNPDEALYGLGQHQQELVNIKDHDLALRQYNTEIYIPFLLSSRGYGILWDNTSFTRFGELADPVPLPNVSGLYVAQATLAPGVKGALPALPGDVAIGDPNGVVHWSGTVIPPVTGDYDFRSYSAGDIKLRVDDRLVIDHWRQGWLPGEDIARVHLVAGKPVAVDLRWVRDIGVNIVRLLWQVPVANRTTSLWSEVGDGIDYTFVYGPDLDRVIAGYRQLTGEATLPPRFAFGLWQCRERYVSQQQSVDVVAGYRSRGIPLDSIVQDWRYWPEGQWGSHRFDPRRFPAPAAWTAELHDRLHAHVMISVWPKFYAGTANFEALRAAGFLYPLNLAEQTRDFLHNVFTYYDAFNPAARQLYWAQINQNLFSKNVDAWWMDATEPEVVEGPWPSVDAQVASNERHMSPTALGSGARMLNAYSLVNSQAIYEGQRAAAPRQRVFILTRNGFAGQQRYGAASWSGDISATWSALRKQVPAGIGFALSGMPYWTLDSGGFSVPGRFASAPRGSANLDEWRELNARWFEYATFLPLLRVHGQAPRREMWEFGGDGSPTYEAQKKFDRLRYRLLPYIYSLAGAVTHGAGMILRPLVMDFRDDRQAPDIREIADEFMFGPALLVSPVTTYRARSRAVTLPRTAGGWYDFWSGKAVAAGTVEAAAPFDAIPVHVRAGAIIPFGPELQYTDEKPADPVTIYVYAGADGTFTLYEDDGTTTDHENGAFSRISLRWTEATQTLTIGKRQGTYPGMLSRRTFQLVLVRVGKPVAFSFSPTPLRTVVYAGEAMNLSL